MTQPADAAERPHGDRHRKPEAADRACRRNKFAAEEFAAVAAAAGFEPRQVWTDADSMFAIHFLAA